MVFRIIKEIRANNVLLHIDGDLCQEGLGEIVRVCEEVHRPLTIDLSSVTSADTSTVNALRDGARGDRAGPPVHRA